MSRFARPRAVVLVWFAGMFIATAGFVGAVSVDYGKVLLVKSEVESVAQDAAVAAARSYDQAAATGALLLDARTATLTAQDIVTAATVGKNLHGASNVKVSVNVTQPDGFWWENGQAPPRVTVTITYDVADLLLMDLFAATTPGGAKTLVSGTAVSSAVICLPGSNPDTLNGACVRSAS
jgi:Flp pilus assembly protein TadG